MEAQPPPPPKRRRVYSLEPNKVVQSIFARNYLSYLVPALMKIKEKSCAKDHCDIIKYEVDMAMVSSAQGFAWSNGLKVKLQRNHINVSGSSRIYDQNNSESKCMSKEDSTTEDDEDKLKRLRRLIPGEEEMCDEQVMTELESYIRCLQMQVNVLQWLISEALI